MRTTKLRYTRWDDREVCKEVRHELNVEDFKGMPGYALLIMAANPHLYATELQMFLNVAATDTNQCERSLNWIRRRRWLFKLANMEHLASRRNCDGKDEAAVAIMRENPSLSARDLAELLTSRGIRRSREWCRRHRCDPPK